MWYIYIYSFWFSYYFSYNYSLGCVCLFLSTVTVLYQHQQRQRVFYQHHCHHNILKSKCNWNTTVGTTTILVMWTDNGNCEIRINRKLWPMQPAALANKIWTRTAIATTGTPCQLLTMMIRDHQATPCQKPVMDALHVSYSNTITAAVGNSAPSNTWYISNYIW